MRQPELSTRAELEIRLEEAQATGKPPEHISRLRQALRWAEMDEEEAELLERLQTPRRLFGDQNDDYDE